MNSSDPFLLPSKYVSPFQQFNITFEWFVIVSSVKNDVKVCSPLEWSIQTQSCISRKSDATYLYNDVKRKVVVGQW